MIETVVYERDGYIHSEIYADNKDRVENKITELNKRLPPYKRIKIIEFRDKPFEKTTTQKIIRKTRWKWANYEREK